MVGYIDIKQQETYEKLKNRDWYSKWYWYFIDATTTDNNNDDDDNTPASTVTYRENNSCRFSFMLLNMSLTRALKYQKCLIFF